ncbi:asparaginase [Dethiosulfatarculus sandiegensis]|uniref:asparaginase n=1 Tax=Dethiosulfatarculus sandiegensis TaxID=1429043 RepID=UPI0009E681AD|nr:asparaginase [Dethiosulfatarculus sandiegensis]
MPKTEFIRRHIGEHHSHNHHHLHHGAGHDNCPPPLVELKRAGLYESLHRGAIVLSDPTGRVEKSLGHPAMPTYLRSAAKPLQALPVIETGAADRFQLTDSELAVMSGSLNGEDFQVKAVRSILKKANLTEDLLDCGVHRPSHRPTAKAMLSQGIKPLPIHNNCAGKHAAMLVLCAHLGFDPKGYTEKGHPVQNLILETVAQLCDYPAEQIGQGIDGCGVPVFRVPLHSLAGAYARLAAPARANLTPERIQAVERLMKACLAHPEMIAGHERLCTRLMQAAPNRFLAKTGTEGSYALAIPELGLGVALQIEDGAMRALAPCVSEILHQLGILDHQLLDGELKDLHKPVLKNHRSQEVAQLSPVFDLDLT